MYSYLMHIELVYNGYVSSCYGMNVFLFDARQVGIQQIYSNLMHNPVGKEKMCSVLMHIKLV